MNEHPLDRPPAEWTDIEIDVGITLAAERRAALDELVHALGVERAERRELARAVDDATTATAEIIDDEC